VGVPVSLADDTWNKDHVPILVRLSRMLDDLLGVLPIDGSHRLPWLLYRGLRIEVTEIETTLRRRRFHPDDTASKPYRPYFPIRDDRHDQSKGS
jgi:hypothetical protein